jgi:hypothetical protein
LTGRAPSPVTVWCVRRRHRRAGREGDHGEGGEWARTQHPGAGRRRVAS